MEDGNRFIAEIILLYVHTCIQNSLPALKIELHLIVRKTENR